MMAKRKKPGVNKSELIRKHMAAHPDDKPAQIVAALKSHGVTVGLVNAVRAKDKTKVKNKAPRKTVKSTPAPSNGHASELLHSALTLGLDKAIELLQKVKKAVG